MTHVYIKQSIAKHFCEFEEPLNTEEYNNIGTTWTDYLENKWVKLVDAQVAFHKSNPNASVKEVWDMEFAQRTLEQAKQEKLNTISEYDSSDNVNGFNVIAGENIITAWLTPEERSNYRSSVEAAELTGMENVSFYIENIPVTLPTNSAKLMLAQIQLYADACFMVTKGHKNAIDALTTVEAVDAYDYTAGYPEKLNFTLS